MSNNLVYTFKIKIILFLYCVAPLLKKNNKLLIKLQTPRDFTMQDILLMSKLIWRLAFNYAKKVSFLFIYFGRKLQKLTSISLFTYTLINDLGIQRNWYFLIIFILYTVQSRFSFVFLHNKVYIINVKLT